MSIHFTSDSAGVFQGFRFRYRSLIPSSNVQGMLECGGGGRGMGLNARWISQSVFNPDIKRINGYNGS